MVFGELRRQLIAPRTLLALVLMAGWLSWQVEAMAELPRFGLVSGADGALAFATEGGSTLIFAFLLAGLFASFGYVEDRVAGRTPYLLVRGVSRGEHLLARMVAPAGAAGATIGASGLIAMGYAQLVLPSGPIRIEGQRAAAVELAPPPVPELFVASPILHDLVWCTGAAVLVFGVCCLAGAVGALVPSRLLVLVTPVLLGLAASFVWPEFADPVNPLLLVPIDPQGPWQVAFGYWVVVAVGAVVVADQVVRRRELV